MSKLAQYISRVSKEDAELEQEQLPATEVEQNEIIAEQELEVPEPVAEVSEAEIEAAEEEAEAADEELADVAEAAEDTAEFEAQAQDEISSIEEFTQILQHGIKTKTYSPQFAALCQNKLAKLSETFGEENKVSLEGFSGDNLSEYYTASLETFSGFMKRLSDLLDNASTKLADKVNKKLAIGNYEKKAKAIMLRADAILAGSAKEQPYVAKGKSVAGDFHFGGKFSGDVAGSLNQDMRFLSGPGAQLIKSCDTYLSGIMDIIDRAVKDGGVGKTGDIVAEALKLKKPVDTLPEAAFEGAMAGGLKFSRGKSTAKGEEDRRGGYKDIGRSALPMVDGVSFKGEADDVSIDKATADKLAKTAKVYAQLALKIVEKNAAKSIETSYRRFSVTSRAIKSANPTSWSENKDLNILASKLLEMGYQQFNVYYVLLDTAFDNINEALKLAEKAVTAAKPAAAE